MNPQKLAVAEHFLSIQGEGQTAGYPAYFLRLAGCNLMCGGNGTQKDGKLHDGATWRCDTIEVWMKGRSKDFDQIVKMMGGQTFINDLRNNVHLIITGGEPLLQIEAIANFLAYFRLVHGITPIVEIETNGTIDPTPLLTYVHFWNVSPKLANSGMAREHRVKPDVLYILRFQLQRTIMKFVISNDSDWDEIKADYLEHILPEQIWLMPAAETRDELNAVSEIVANIAIRERVRMSTRMQVVVWNKKVGV